MTLKIQVAVVAAALALAGLQARAQQVYKCQDGAGKITYANNECAALGLRSAGEVKESVNVAPAFKAPPRPPAPAPAPAAQSAPPKAEQVAEPERRCFTVKTAKGVTTRCNDTPEDADK